MSRGLRMAAAIAALGLCSPVFAADIDWKKVEDALGKAGAAQPDGVYRVGLPRSDLKVTLDGVERAKAPWSWATSCSQLTRSIP
jgi:hypothetical protein